MGTFVELLSDVRTYIRSQSAAQIDRRASDLLTNVANLDLLVVAPTVVGVHEVPDLDATIGSHDFTLNKTVLPLGVLFEVQTDITAVTSLPHDTLLVDDLPDGEGNADVAAQFLTLGTVRRIPTVILGDISERLLDSVGVEGSNTLRSIFVDHGGLDLLVAFGTLLDDLTPVNVIRPVLPETRRTSHSVHEVLLEEREHFTLVDEQHVLVGLGVGIQVQPLVLVGLGVDQLEQDTIDVFTLEDDHTGHDLGVELVEPPDREVAVGDLGDDAVVARNEGVDVVVVLGLQSDYRIVGLLAFADVEGHVRHGRPETQGGVGGTADFLEVVVLVPLVEVEHVLVALLVEGDELEEVLAVRHLVDGGLGDLEVRGVEDHDIRFGYFIEQVAIRGSVNDPDGLVLAADGVDVVVLVLATLELKADVLAGAGKLENGLVGSAVQLVTTDVGVKLVLNRQVDQWVQILLVTLLLLFALSRRRLAKLRHSRAGAALSNTLNDVRRSKDLVVNIQDNLEEQPVEQLLLEGHPYAITTQTVVHGSGPIGLVDGQETEQLHAVNPVVDGLPGKVPALGVKNDLFTQNDTLEGETFGGSEDTPDDEGADLDVVRMPGRVDVLGNVEVNKLATSKVVAFLGSNFLGVEVNVLAEKIRDDLRAGLLNNIGLHDGLPVVRGFLEEILVDDTLVVHDSQLQDFPALDGKKVRTLHDRKAGAVPDKAPAISKPVDERVVVRREHGLGVGIAGDIDNPVPPLVGPGLLAEVNLDEFSSTVQLAACISAQSNKDGLDLRLLHVNHATRNSVVPYGRGVTDVGVAVGGLEVHRLLHLSEPIHSANDEELFALVHIGQNLQTDLSRERVEAPDRPRTSHNLFNVVVVLGVVNVDVLGAALAATIHAVLLELLIRRVQVQGVGDTLPGPGPDELGAGDHGKAAIFHNEVPVCIDAAADDTFQTQESRFTRHIVDDNFVGEELSGLVDRHTVVMNRLKK
ncbi:D-2-hydroxyacid dehydrogenase [Babesia caballi]|uniref:D-2-hydroxyacid dehydrogenase n=1 Tax=Babesia caballi TaxID=5871 RepID=A0AAV4LZQ3_BABCB|nr:D-2-hydroxyacid dehydrogenase [Babesia caballi]